MVSARWDESTFVTSDGASAGRLIRGETRKMDVSNAQPATPIAPGSSIVQVVFPEKGVGSEEEEADAIKQGYQPKVMWAPLLERRQKEAALIVGGKLVVTLDAAGQRVTWTGAIVATEKAPVATTDAKFWCVGVGSDGLGGNCAERRADCIATQAKLEKLSSDIRGCEAAKSAWCYTIDSEHQTLCWDTQARCEEHQADVARRAFGVGPCADMF